MLIVVKQTESLTVTDVTVKDLANDQLKAANLAWYTVLASNMCGRARDIVKEES